MTFVDKKINLIKLNFTQTLPTVSSELGVCNSELGNNNVLVQEQISIPAFLQFLSFSVYSFVELMLPTILAALFFCYLDRKEL